MNKLKIQYMSDLHFEFGSKHLLDIINKCQSDVLVIAGDLTTSQAIVPCLKEVYRAVRNHIIFVPGNHEYYYSTKQYVDEILNEFDDHDFIHVLNNDVFGIKDVVFLGSTGWWTMNQAKQSVKSMNDYRLIYDIIPANNGLDWGWESYEFFNKELRYFDKRGHNGKKVVCVSHNAPSLKSIGDAFQGDELNPCFVNAWEHLMLSYKPDAWIHGHIHDTKDYRIDDTRVLCNPYGYKGMKHALNTDFDPCKVVEI
jgi:Icc-related predicted phosphoesterase